MDFLARFTMTGLEVLTTIFIFVVGLGVLAVFFMFIADSSQSKDAIRHNYPVVGRFRELFTRLGEFFRQYFFALDREEKEGRAVPRSAFVNRKEFEAWCVG